jgi:hypothetical protein
MKIEKSILILFVVFGLFFFLPCKGQVKKTQQTNEPASNGQLPSGKGYRVSSYVYHGDTIPSILYPTVYIYPPLTFKNDNERMEYVKLVYNVKKVLPIAIEINNLILETYEYLETLPNDKARIEHINRVEKGLKDQYTARMKKLTYKQGKLLIKLVDRQSGQASYDVIKAFMGPLRANLYQAFAWFYGASLKKTYDPNGEDKLTERVVTMVLQGQI